MTDFERRLAALTPAEVDREAVLFAAGRAATPSRRPWQCVCGLLAVTQVGSVVALWPARPAPAPPAPATIPRPPAGPLDPSSYLALLRSWDQPPPAPPAGTAAPDPRPLFAGSRDI